MDGVASANLLTDALALANWQNALVGAVITAFVTVIVKLTSIFFTACYDYVRFNFIPSSYEYEVDLAARNPRVFELADFKCLIVRYGTDSFLRHMASPEEKKDGRLQLKILEVPVKKEGDRMTLRLSIPVHKRIGTQFKCFANVKQPGQMNELLEILENCTAISDVTISDSAHKTRVYFLIKQFASIPTMDEIGDGKTTSRIMNNFVFPE